MGKPQPTGWIRRNFAGPLTALSVRGFKSLADECRIELRDVTILAGANSSGKSSAIQPLLLLKQTLEAQFDPGPLLISGPNIQFTRPAQFLTQILGKALSKTFEIGLEVHRRTRLRFVFKRGRKKAVDRLEIDEVRFDFDGCKGVLRPTMSEADATRAAMQLLPAVLDAGVRAAFSDILKRQRWSSISDRFFVDLRTDHPTFPFAMEVGSVVRNHIRGVIHVPGLGGNPERAYKRAAIRPAFQGLFNDYVASVILDWKESKDPLLEELGSSLKKLGLTWKVDAKPLDAANVEIKVARMPESKRGGGRDMVSIADVGFGVSQVLPVVVALLAARPGQLVYIEQPEIHLHPRAQVGMAELLAEAAHRGVRLVVETHSSLLLLAIQSLIAEGKLSPKKVGLHWFERSRSDGMTTVRSADLDDAGAFGDWPVDFGDVERKADSRYLDAAEKHLRPKHDAA